MLDEKTGKDTPQPSLSRRAFSIPPHARMYWRAWTSMVFPSGPATDRPLHEAPFDSSRTAKRFRVRSRVSRPRPRAARRSPRRSR